MADTFGLDRPSLARIHDLLLGGRLHNAVDRVAAQSLTAAFPSLAQLLAGHRRFLQEVVRSLIRLGVSQFLELGSGVPTWGHVHHVAHQQDPAAKVLYVDNCASTVALGREVLTGTGNATMIQADVNNPAEVLRHPHGRRFLDFTRPVAVLLVGVLDHIPNPAKLIAGYRVCSSAATYLAATHLTTDGASPGTTEQFKRMAERHHELVGLPLVTRRRATMRQWLRRTSLLGPGVTHPVHWRLTPARATEPDEVDALALCAVGVSRDH